MEAKMVQNNRIHSFYDIDKNAAAALLTAFDKSIITDIVTPIHSGMSTSNYCITSGTRKYLLKIYSGNARNIEPVMYSYLRNRIRIPDLYYYDDSRKICPYPYAIIEYINGETLSEHVKHNHGYPIEIVQEIGRMLSTIHQQTYTESGLLNQNLNLEIRGGKTAEFIMDSLNGKPGTRLSYTVRDKIFKFLESNNDILNRIDCNFVLCHGDMSNGNIIISDGRVYFIDFEYAMAESRYRDIGKMFRNKEPEVQQYINTTVYKAFTDGYDDLPSDWLHIAKIADIPVMLGLLNIDTAPKEWVDDIEHDIMEAIH